MVTDTIGIVGRNAYHVLWLDGETNTPITGATTVDGFIITAGQADGRHSAGHGGGMYCAGSGSGAECSPTLSNVLFSGNRASSGGAVYNDDEHGISNPTLAHVTFSGNSANIVGGAIVNNGFEGGESSPTLSSLTFSGNSAWRGGAM